MSIEPINNKVSKLLRLLDNHMLGFKKDGLQVSFDRRRFDTTWYRFISVDTLKLLSTDTQPCHNADESNCRKIKRLFRQNIL